MYSLYLPFITAVVKFLLCRGLLRPQPQSARYAAPTAHDALPATISFCVPLYAAAAAVSAAATAAATAVAHAPLMSRALPATGPAMGIPIPPSLSRSLPGPATASSASSHNAAQTAAAAALTCLAAGPAAVQAPSAGGARVPFNSDVDIQYLLRRFVEFGSQRMLLM